MTPPNEAGAKGPRGKPPRVLIVDDDVDILKMAKRFLDSQGMNVMTTNAPFGVLELLREHAPDVVVLDLMIPGLDGSALYGFIGAHSKASIVFYTASAGDAVATLRRDHPNAAVVAKGGPLTQLEAAIRNALP